MESDNSIVKRDSNLPAASDSRGLPAKVAGGIASALRDKQDSEILSTFGQFFSATQVSDEFRKTIDKGVTYIAKIPKNLEAKFNAGELNFMVKKDTGESLGAIVGTDKMNRGFVRIEEAAPVTANLAGSLASLAMQQQLAQIADVVNEVRSRIIELKTIHDHDLLGSLRGMHKQLNQIKATKEPITQKQLTTQAITVLNDTLGKIEQRFIDELNELPEVPKNKFSAGIKVLTTRGYLPKIEQGYELIQELFEYYLSAMQMLAYAYAFLGEDSVATSMFIPSKELCENPNLLKMVQAEALCAEESVGITWYKAPEKYIQRLSRETERILTRDNVYLSIKITSEQLLEVLPDGKATKE